jgi:hypothetical protein
MLSVFAARWRKLPEGGQLGIVVNRDGKRVQIAESRLIPFKYVMADWSDLELAVAVSLTIVEMRLPASFTTNSRLIAATGLHSLARRFKRGTDRRDSAVLRDLSVFGQAWSEAVQKGGDFEIPVRGFSYRIGGKCCRLGIRRQVCHAPAGRRTRGLTRPPPPGAEFAIRMVVSPGVRRSGSY